MPNALVKERLMEEIISDMKVSFRYSERDATKFASDYIDDIIGEMWSRYMDELSYHDGSFEPYEATCVVGGE